MVAKWLGTTAPTTGTLAKQRIATIGKDGKTYYWTSGNYASGATENIWNAAEMRAVAWYEKNSGGVAKAVGVKRANALGLYDVNGNLREWQFMSRSTYRGISGEVAGQ
jgi:formylglycine-generating enzyme required for sulfatase activity